MPKMHTLRIGALIVHGHAQLVARHANDAAKYRVEHDGDGGVS